MQTQQEENYTVEKVLKNLKNHIKTKYNKNFPEGDLIKDHTTNFIKDRIGYSNAPVFFNPSNYPLSLFLEWKEFIIDQLELLDDKKYNKYNNTDNESLHKVINYIKNMQKTIKKGDYI
ncbi:hypothetical protein GWK08_06625 [Leptobacterium flavescens]|uniref:Uncharacterized protein n=1 Tax=Leptobacterium flavescens TaxID=472055 RepID=A0A6P0URU7_9FLAO|nr:hypothetical protein [Leptobacterium flavescens]NER13106.1 hypothetical protein [Leptobacterium flavescens]